MHSEIIHYFIHVWVYSLATMCHDYSVSPYIYNTYSNMNLVFNEWLLRQTYFCVWVCNVKVYPKVLSCF